MIAGLASNTPDGGGFIGFGGEFLGVTRICKNAEFLSRFKV
jgi:hypothetical protein